MALTRDFRKTVVKHVQDDPAFRAALVEEAARNVLEGYLKTALGQLRDVVNATMGFDALTAETGIPKTSLMRMLGDNGNPRAGNLVAILKAVGKARACVFPCVLSEITPLVAASRPDALRANSAGNQQTGEKMPLSQVQF